MTTKVQKWGNSLAVRLPRHVAEDVDLGEGSVVNVAVRDRQIIICTTEKRRKYSLGELVKGITPKNIHGEAEWGNSLGKEVW